MNETHARLRWACRRGMLELDAILQPFFDRYFSNLNPKQQQTFARLLECTDPELYNWFIGSEVPEDPDLYELVTLIKNSEVHPFQ